MTNQKCDELTVSATIAKRSLIESHLIGATARWNVSTASLHRPKHSSLFNRIGTRSVFHLVLFLPFTVEHSWRKILCRTIHSSSLWTFDKEFHGIEWRDDRFKSNTRVPLHFHILRAIHSMAFEGLPFNAVCISLSQNFLIEKNKSKIHHDIKANRFYPAPRKSKYKL